MLLPCIVVLCSRDTAQYNLGAFSAHRFDAGLQLAGPLAPPSHTGEVSSSQPQVSPEDGPCSVA